MEYTYDYYRKSADYIRSVIGDFEPEIGLILGTGLGKFSARIEDPVEIPYKDIPNYLVSTAPGHSGKLIFGTVEGRKVMCMSGRFHTYEGYSFEELSIPVRVMKLMGVKLLVATNAAGAVNVDYRPGDVMIIKDHIKLNGFSPMRGPNVPEFGDRFFDISDLYCRELRQIAEQCGEDSGLTIHEGVYFFFPGPQFETPAEVRAARILGGDAVGMSTVTETLTAGHCGMPVLGLSLMTNMAAGVLEQKLSGEEVEETAQRVAPLLEAYFAKVLKALPHYE
ncbi:MAG: purine-nucleoside phosphorylase [Firmicutes bacterium]|nr:purine-nucleoside phosphorylase [Bacillota bacterium]MBQ6295578.1 purine-nucleoside phosphorylase [Bacillota bacterium]